MSVSIFISTYFCFTGMLMTLVWQTAGDMSQVNWVLAYRLIGITLMAIGMIISFASVAHRMCVVLEPDEKVRIRCLAAPLTFSLLGSISFFACIRMESYTHVLAPLGILFLLLSVERVFHALISMERETYREALDRAQESCDKCIKQ